MTSVTAARSCTPAIMIRMPSSISKPKKITTGLLITLRRHPRGASAAGNSSAINNAVQMGLPSDRIEAEGADRSRTILYLHGGAYVLGSRRTHRGLAAQIALVSGASVHLLDYRLGPEHKHPAGIEDSIAAYRELLASGIDAKSIVIAGDSAGGGLTVATLLALRDADVPLPAAAVCISPWVDLSCGGGSYASRADVDPKAIDFEASIRNGKTYSYFGIFPALLRLLALPVTDLASAHLARLSCLTAIVIFVALQLRMLFIVHDSLPAGSRRSEFLAVMVAATQC